MVKLIDVKVAVLVTLMVNLVACGGGSGGGNSGGGQSKTSEAVASSTATSVGVSSIASSSTTTSFASSLPAKNWAEAEILEEMPNSYYGTRNPHLASGVNGQVALAWLENGIWAKQYAPQTGWGQAVKLNTEDHIDSISRGPEIAADGLGNLFAVWTGIVNTQHKTWVARYTPENGWGAAQYFDGNMSGSIALSVNQQGMAVVSWLDWINSERRIRAVQYTSGSGWGSEVTIASPKSNTAEINVQLNDAGDVLLAWYDLSETTPYELSLNFASFSSVSGWSAAQQLTSTTLIIDGTNFLPELMADSSNNIWLFWLYSGDIWSSKFQPGSGMGASTKVVDTSKTVLQTAAAIGVDDRIQLVWNEYHHANLETFHARQYTSANGWGQIKTLVESGINRVSDVVITPNGDAQVFLADPDGGVHQIDSIYLGADGVQQSSVQQVIYSALGDLDSLQAIADSEGNIWATGVIGTNGEMKIWFNKYE